jgi:hypothetical protein
VTDKKSSKKTKEPVMLDIGILCALTEDAPKPEDLVEPASDDDGASDYDAIPLGWIQIRVTRRVLNPEYVEYIQAREESIAAGFAQAMEGAQQQGVVPTDEQKEATERVMRRTATATFHSVLRDTPKYIVVTDDVWVSPPERNKQVAEEIERLGKGLRIDFAGSEE